MVNIVSVGISVILLNSLSVQAESCPTRCRWNPWDPWSECSRTCGGGRQYRYRSYCCKSSLAHDIEACLNNCGRDVSEYYDGYRETQNCNTWCYNGGTIGSYGCQCPDVFYDFCCSQGNTLHSVTVVVSTKLLVLYHN